MLLRIVDPLLIEEVCTANDVVLGRREQLRSSWKVGLLGNVTQQVRVVENGISGPLRVARLPCGAREPANAATNQNRRRQRVGGGEGAGSQGAAGSWRRGTHTAGQVTHMHRAARDPGRAGGAHMIV